MSIANPNQMIFKINAIKPFLSNSVNAVVRNICADQIGSGCYRDVYVLRQNPDYVVKIERDMSLGTFANATEWRNYMNNREWPFLNEWLAPCELINETGQILIQKRVYWDGRKRKDYPKQVPVVFTDLKVSNFGWTAEGKFVCCDYSFFVLPMTNNRMRYARWWGSVKSLNKKP